MPKRRTTKKVVDGRALLDDLTPEEGREGLRKAIVDLAVLLGWLVHHCYDSRLCGPCEGMPDLILVGFGRVLFIELKKQTGKQSRSQYLWAYELQRANAEYYLWRPRDWQNGTVDKILASRPKAA